MFIGLLISETKNPDDAKRCTMGLIADEDWAAMQREPIPTVEELDRMSVADMAAMNERHDKREAAFARVHEELALALRALPPFPDAA